MKKKNLQFRNKGNRTFAFYLEMTELWNKKVLLYAQGYVTTTFHSEKRPTERETRGEVGPAFLNGVGLGFSLSTSELSHCHVP